MIKSVIILAGKGSFTTKLYKHSKNDVTFNFTDGVNVITGRNGSGKSVLLNIIKTNCCIDKYATYPTMPEPMKLFIDFFNSDKLMTMPEYIDKRRKNLDFPKINLDWDGSIVHYLTPNFFDFDSMWKRMDAPSQYRGKELFSEIEIISGKMTPTSSGEKVVNILTKINNLNLEYNELNNAYGTWKKASELFLNWINERPRDGKPTLLIDELDEHLDLDNQNLYWNYINFLAKKWQVIVVSHSVFAFLRNDVNHISLNKKYFNSVRKLFINNQKNQ